MAAVPPPAVMMAKNLPGLALTSGIAYAAEAAAKRTALSPLLWAAVVGMAVRAVWPQGMVPLPKAGISFAKARLLRFGIILYGAKLTVQQIAAIGAAGLLTDLFAIGTALPLGVAL